MKKDVEKLFKSFYFIILSNFVSLSISIVILLVVPKYLGVSEFGYFQLYILYSGLVGFLHFGINDGLFLRLGGKNYNTLDKNIYFSQLYLFFLFQLIVCISIYYILSFYPVSDEKKFVLTMTLICALLSNVRYMLLFVLQSTFRIKEYSIVTILDRAVFLISVILLISFNSVSFEYIIWFDILSKLATLILSGYLCKDIVFRNFREISIGRGFREMLSNIRVGFKLLCSNLAGKMIIGNVRLAIETVWSVSVFGQISLMLSATGFLMIFISAIGTVLFPFLRKVENKVLPEIYLNLREVLSVFLSLFLLSYYFLYLGLEYWLPSYKDSLVYFHIVFPIIVFEGKISLLIDTYLKVLRKESIMLQVNFLTLALSCLITFIAVYVVNDLKMAIFSILIVTAIKSIVFEVYLQKILSIKVMNKIYVDLFAVFVFLLSNELFPLSESAIIYASILLLIIANKKNSLLKTYGLWKIISK